MLPTPKLEQSNNYIKLSAPLYYEEHADADIYFRLSSTADRCTIKAIEREVARF